MIDGAKITFPSPNEVGKDLVFRATSVSISHTIEPGVVTGGGNIIGLLSDLANQDVQGNGNRQQARVDLGGGPHITTLQFRNWRGSDDRWGATDGSIWDAGGDGPVTQLQVLDNAFRSIRIDSEGNEIALDVGEYSTSGRFEPLQVAPSQTAVDFDVQTSASTFTGDISFVDIVSLEQALDAAEQKT